MVLVLAFCRTFTGIVYRADSPVACLVPKNGPGLRIERSAHDGAPVEALTALDCEERDLVYAHLHIATMRIAPLLGAAALLVPLILTGMVRRRT